MTTLREQWEIFRQTELPSDAAPALVQACRRAFYAGASDVTIEMGEVISDARSAARLIPLAREVRVFIADVREGRA